ncbi:hypothetical protein KDM41_10365, partial [bacterium]|nr:hypothetical protein [bacterium]
MTALTLNHEFGLMRLRFQRTLVVSVLLHAALLAAIAAVRDLAPAPDAIIEITWLEQPAPPELAAAPEAETITPIEQPAPPPARVEPNLSVKEKLARAGQDRTPVREKLGRL